MQDQPAFPQPIDAEYFYGLTIRDYFAARVLNGLISKYGPENPKVGAEIAYKYADAMLKVRGERG